MSVESGSGAGTRLAPSLSVGRVIRSHGLDGKVIARPHGSSLASLEAGARVRAEGGKGQANRDLTLVSSQPHGRGILLKFREIEDCGTAKELSGAELLVAREALSPLGPNEYYCADLIGLSVLNRAGSSLGVLEEVLSNPEHDLFQVKAQDGRVHLVPVIGEIVLSVRPEDGIVVIDPPEGLFE